VGLFTVIGTVVAAFVAGVTAAFITIVAGITALFAITSRTLVKIVSLPFRPCLRNQDPISPLGTSPMSLSNAEKQIILRLVGWLMDRSVILDRKLPLGQGLLRIIAMRNPQDLFSQESNHKHQGEEQRVTRR
jgi:hypothetical protein